MDKGAHYFKCDFQVHSPRDIQWTGHDFGVDPNQIADLSESEKQSIINDRKQFAREYLNKIRIKGLNAIAITDHHDVVFAKIIRSVAEEENRAFRIAGEEDKCITVFPGIELTLDSPICQCLILFDSDFPDAHLDSALGILGITPSNEFEKKTAEVVRIPSTHIQDLPHLQKKLNDVPYCIGRYIILPNVNHGGTSTIFRNGGQATYKKMPCVGGYVDKAIPTDTGWINKTSGGDVNYGNKTIGVISTSDNRYEDGREFGNYYSWVKWSEPSAEAFRQACLAKESRLSQANPTIPQIYITKIDVTSSKFLGSFSIEFNQQYNCFIGGRGTGKSTVLEYLRWVLCDQTIFTGEPEELTEIERRRKNLIDKTLVPFGGEVRVTFIMNGVNHIIKRDSVSNELSLKIGSAEFRRVSDDEVRRILPIQAYSQKQLSSVGVTAEELKRFIQTPITSEIAGLKFELEENVQQTKANYLNLQRKRAIEKEVEQISLEMSSLRDQVQNLRQSLTGISAEDQATIARKPILDNEGNFISSVQRELNTINTQVNDFERSLQNFPEPFPTSTTFENSQLLNDISTERDAKIREVKGLIEQIRNALKPENSQQIRSLISQWQLIKTSFDGFYETAKSNTTSNQQQLQEIQRIEARLYTLQNNINERVESLRHFGDPQNSFDQLRSEYWEIHRRKGVLLNEQAEKFEILSENQIKVEILKNIDLSRLKEELVTTLTGSRVGSDKIQAIFDNIANKENPLAEWKEVLQELKLLAEFNQLVDGGNVLPATPKLLAAGLNSNNLSKIADILTSESWIALGTLSIDFSPKFEYSTNNEMGDVIPFAEASAGQQATALLTVLLNQPGAPLIIDQPEDDIDNRAIDDIIKSIWEAKKHRQLIFTSHNANLVVNGDSELVVCFDYRDAGSQTRGIIKAEGAIDCKAVKDEITSVMEGGEKAFKLRKDKYGF